ncbi:MAG TPA: YfdX family protein [Gammaproteobacteria bacterium]|nr:YfdX family protein [Gammaproteobacteria bacterium]
MKTPVLKILPLLVSAALGGAALQVPAAFAETLKENVTIEPGRSITPQEESILSRSAAYVLRHIAAARSAIQQDDPELAAKQLEKARKLIDIIKSARPTTKVVDHIWVDKKDLDYQTVDEVAVDLIPIYTDLAELDELLPAGKTRDYLSRKGGGEATAAKLKAIEDAVAYTEVDLPLAATERQVIAAQKQLAAKQLNQADEALAKAENAVQVVTLVVESPMAKAREDLWQATRDYATGQYDAVRKDLASARNWLARAGRDGDRLTREAASRLEKAIARIDTSISAAGGADTAHKLEGLWHRAVALAEREAERVSIGWSKHRSTAEARAELIEAKQHIAFAENLQFYAESTPDDIYKALDDARAELEKARASKRLDDATRNKIVALETELAQIRKDPADRSRYRDLRTKLRAMIASL